MSYVKINIMEATLQPSQRAFTRRWWISLPFVVAIIVLGFILWTAVRATTYPHDGIENLQPDGLISGIEAGGPADGRLVKGDVIKEIDGVPWGERITTYPGKHPGDLVSFVVDRSGKEFHISIRLTRPDGLEVFSRLIPLLVSLIFWGIGLGVQTFKTPDSAADVFFTWCQVSALTLSAGVASYLGPEWTAKTFSALLWFLGPISVHLHFYFPQEAPFRRRRLVLGIFYLIALLGAFPHIASATIGFNLRLLEWYPQWLSFSRLYLAVNLLFVVVLLTYDYFHATAPGVRGKIRLVALGGGLTALLLVTLTLLPDALFQNTIIPYEFAFFMLIFIPLTYGYAIFRYHLIEIEHHVNRGATIILVYSILGACYLILYFVLHRFLPSEIVENRMMDTLLVLFLATIFIPLHGRVQRFVDTIFYGGWYDYRLAVTNITHGLELVNDFHELAKIISQRLVDTLRLEEACVFFRDPDGEFSIIEAASRFKLDNQPLKTYPQLPRSSLEFLLNMGVVERNYLREALSEVTLSPEELQLLESEQIHLWVPIIVHAKIQGLLALGPKLSGDVFSAEDIDIMRVVARQIGPVLENLHLVTRLRKYASELEQRVEARTAELFASKERVEAILSSVGEGVVVTNLSGDIETINKAFVRQSGYSMRELGGRDFFAILAEQNDNQVIQEMQKALSNGEIWSGELLSLKKNGRLYDVLLTIAPVRDQSGRIVNYVASQRDITQLKELDRMKDVFVADVSHELRTPTTNINLYLDLLEVSPPEKQARYMAIIREQSRQLTKLVEDILDLSRLAKARVAQVEFKAVDLNEIIEDVIIAHQPMAKAVGLDLIYQTSGQAVNIQGEYNQLSRMLTNLVSNAIRYTHQGEVTVSLQKPNPVQACISVRDTGLGIPGEDLPRIFDRFYRATNVRQTNIHGTGLGLSIVKEIVHLHHGKIEVQSECGKGSEFKVWLPVVEDENDK